MIYTVRYCHLEHASKLKIGDRLKYGDHIGRMGNTGQSTGAHLHLDGVKGSPKWLFKMHDIEIGILEPIPLRQLNYFIDKDLFKYDYEITTFYGDPRYQSKFKKVHYGIDIIPKDGNPEYFDIYWNRTKEGNVIFKGHDHKSYGHFIYIGFSI